VLAITFTVKAYKNLDTNEVLEPMENFETINLSLNESIDSEKRPSS